MAKLLSVRAQVLLALQRVVNALGSESPACYPLLLPVLRLCTDPSQVRGLTFGCPGRGILRGSWSIFGISVGGADFHHMRMPFLIAAEH